MRGKGLGVRGKRKVINLRINVRIAFAGYTPYPSPLTPYRVFLS